MGKTKQLTKQKPARGRGRPASERPKLTMTIRFSREMIADLDVYAQENGELDRSSAIRLLLANGLRNAAAKKSA